MANFLPEKKHWFQYLVELPIDFVFKTRPARISSEAARINNDNLIEYYEKRDSIQQQMEAGKMQLQALIQQRNFEFQYEQGNLNRQFQVQEGKLNRELQTQLAILNQEFKAQEGKLNRELQAELARLNREFQAQEGNLNRENAYQLEIFRAKLQIFLQEKQKELQLQFKEIDATLARELKAINLQNNLTVIRQQRRLNNWPLTLDDEQIKEIVKSDNLLILFVPPILKYDLKLGSQASPFKGIKKAVERWMGFLTISNRPRERIFLMSSLLRSRGTDN
ncbi:MAG: hypothetical protein SWX82_21575 [Cyanobacteriota bacterium]|nr:hypothetical protein [Cyanobacteriota bacterium]